jgi:hypothetical protein
MGGTFRGSGARKAGSRVLFWKVTRLIGGGRGCAVGEGWEVWPSVDAPAFVCGTRDDGVACIAAVPVCLATGVCRGACWAEEATPSVSVVLMCLRFFPSVRVHFFVDCAGAALSSCSVGVAASS